MGYQYSDLEMMMAAEIAYLDVTPGKTVGQAVDNILKWGHCENGKWVLDEKYQSNSELKHQFEVAVAVKEFGEKYEQSGIDWRDWKVIDQCNDKNGTGYYGCLIDKGDGSAIIANRGTEFYDGNQVKKDIFQTDLALLDAETTGQHERAARYMEELYYRYGDKYDSFGLTGHSLGGNISQHMMIHAPAEMQDKIDRCLSLDGPGFSQEYIDKNRHLIENVDDRMDHYQWSFISSLLIPLPGVNVQVIDARDGDGLLSRHSIDHVYVDENGNVRNGDKSDLSKILGPISRYFEHLGEGTFIDVTLPYLPKALRLIMLYKLVRDVAEVFYQIKESVKEKIASIYYDYIAPNVSGEYEIQLDAVRSYEAELKKAQKKLDAVTDEIRTISRTWNNWSASGAYYRSQLNIIKNGLELDVRVLSSLAKTTENIVNAYIAADNNVANLFS